MGTNIYKISVSELTGFFSFHAPKKVIVFYKTDCPFCKSQIEVIRKFAVKETGNVDFAICDVENNLDFCRRNGIGALPYTCFYRNGEKVLSRSSFIPAEEFAVLENTILQSV